MTQKIRMIAFAGLLSALALGAAAINARPDGENERPGIAKGDGSPCCPESGVCGANIVVKDAPADKCCCKPDKTCDNCVCGKETTASNCPAECGTCPNAAYAGCTACPSACMTPAMGPVPPCFGPGMPVMHPGMVQGMAEGHFPWSPPPGPHNFPGPIPFTIPPPPSVPFMTVASPAATAATQTCFVVEMKLMEQAKGKEAKTVAMPKLCVAEGEAGQMSCGTSHAHLWQMGVPANDMGHEGYQVNVVVTSEKPGHVRLGCWLWTSELEQAETLRESRCNMTRVIELGKTAKFNCDRIHDGECVRCWMEMTVKEYKDEEQKVTWTAPTPRPLCAATQVMKAIRVPVHKHEAVFFDKNVCCSATAKKSTPKMSFTVVEAPEHFVVTDAEGKLRDLQSAGKLLEATCCGDTKMTCAKMELKQGGSHPVTVSVKDGQVYLEGEGTKAYADKVTTEGGCVVTLEGHVRVESNDKVTMKVGKVRVDLDEVYKTGVISSPSLIQD